MTEDAITRMAVLGAGVMGSEIARVAAAAGLEVVLLDPDPVALERGAAHIARIGARRVARGRMTAEEAAAIEARVTPAADDGAPAGCGLVVEAVPGIVAVKREVAARLDAALPPGAPIASNTSGLSITAISRSTSRPDRVLGLHFFNPGERDAAGRGRAWRDDQPGDGRGRGGARPGARQGARARARVPGIPRNRILVRAMAEAYRSAEASGASRVEVDRAVVEGGPAPMGPFALGDLIGLDTLGHIRRDLQAAYGDQPRRRGRGRPRGGRRPPGRQERRELPRGRRARAGSGSGSGVGEAARAAAGADYAGALDEARPCVDEGIAVADDVALAMRHGRNWSAGPPGL